MAAASRVTQDERGELEAAMTDIANGYEAILTQFPSSPNVPYYQQQLTACRRILVLLQPRKTT